VQTDTKSTSFLDNRTGICIAIAQEPAPITPTLIFFDNLHPFQAFFKQML